MAEQNGTGDAQDWWRKAYEKLSEMKRLGIMLPTDEQYLAILREKAAGNSGNTTTLSYRAVLFWLVWLLLTALAVWLTTISGWLWIISGPLLLIGLFALLVKIPNINKRLRAWAAEVQRKNQSGS